MGARVTAVVISRRFAGIGDWLMALQCAHLINRQRPDIDVYVSWETPNEPLPEFVKQAWHSSNVIFRTTEPPTDARHTGHLIYRHPGHFMPSMLVELNARTGLQIRWQPVWPEFKFNCPRSGRHLCMIGQGKGVRSRGKDPGFEYFNQVARELGKHRRLVQLGAAGDRRLDRADHSLLGAEFDDVAAALVSGDGFIGIENGIMILAGFLDVPQVTLYNGRGAPDRVAFADQYKIYNPIHPGEACTRILKNL